MKARSRLFWFSLLATGFTLVVVILGSYTRLVDAGLGCPDWPGCYGFLTVPESSADIATAEARFPDSPVEVEKGWPEMVHRYAVGILGILVLSITAIAVRARMKGDYSQPFKLPLLLLGVIICQALFGMWTVTLKLWPQVVTGHLLGGFTTLSLLLLLTLRYGGTRWTAPDNLAATWARLKPWTLLGLVIVVAQITLGGWTASNYAAFACYDLPTCQEQWWPAMDFAAGFNIFQSVGPNYLGGLLDNDARVAIHMSHRIGAIVTALYLSWLCWTLYSNAGNTALRGFSGLLFLALAVQLVLGLSNVMLKIPVGVAVAHNAGGAVLLLILVAINYYLITANRGVEHG